MPSWDSQYWRVEKLGSRCMAITHIRGVNVFVTRYEKNANQRLDKARSWLSEQRQFINTILR